MGIRLCWIPTPLHLMVKSSRLVQLARCFRKQYSIYVIILLLISAVIVSVQTLRNRDTYSSAKLHSFPVHFIDSKTAQVPVSYKYQYLSKKHFSYGVVIDCGSSGSRVFVYYWPTHSGTPSELLNIRQLLHEGKPVVKKINPGLATNANKPKAVSTYLKPLLEYATLHVPVEKQKETSLYVLCTAGMRMLTKRLQRSISDQVYIAVQKHSNFHFLSSHAEVISGMTEGLYFWMGLNYALSNLHQVRRSLPDSSSAATTISKNMIEIQNRLPTVGVIDMGGASLQIAFEVNQEEIGDDYLNHIMKVNLGCSEHKSDQEYKVFVDTLLHRGGNAVRSMYERDVLLDFAEQNHMGSAQVVMDPCLPVGFIQEISKSVSKDYKITLFLNGTGDFHECRLKVLSYIDKSSCDHNSSNCILDGRKMPSIDYIQKNFFGSSEFFYCMDDVLGIGGPYEKSVFEDKAAEYCATPWNITWQRHLDGYYKEADLNRLKFQCFKSAWVSVVLHEGLNFPSTYKHFTSVKYINNSEIQWTLGAILYKTRLLPMHEIQLQYLQDKIDDKKSDGGFLRLLNSAFLFVGQSPFFLIVCIGIVIIYVLIAAIRFCLHLDRRKVASLRRVGSSVAYFVHEEV